MTGRDPSQQVPDEPDADARQAGKRPARGRRSKPVWFGMLSQLDFDIAFFDRLLERRPDSLDVLRVLAELVSRKGQVQRAVDLDRRLVELQPDDFLARSNLACSLARAGRPDEAIDSLSRAILLGYDDLAHMDAIPTWRASATIRITRRSSAATDGPAPAGFFGRVPRAARRRCPPS